MALTEGDLKALGTLMEQTFDRKIEPFRREMNSRFDTVQGQILELYDRDDRRQQEYEVISAQLNRHDKQFEKIDKQFEKIDTRFDRIEERLDRIEQKVDQHDRYFDDLEGRVTELESKSASTA